MEAASTAVSQYNTGKAAFDSGNYAAAKPALERALSAFGKLPSDTCQTYAARAQRRLGTIEETLAQTAAADRAISTCNLTEMKRVLAANEKRKLPVLTESSARIRAALPDCEEKDRADTEDLFCDVMGAKVDAASANFMDNRLKAARLALLGLDQELTPSNTEHCLELNARVRRGLDQIDRLESEGSRVAQAEKACDIGKLEELADRYSGKTHPWFKDASARARGAIEDCQDEPPTEEEAIADCHRQAVNIGKVYGTTKFEPDGSYTCHTCDKGQVSTGKACVTDVVAAEADCRQQATAAGKAYAKTVVHNDGGYDCHWCEPGQTFVNDQCGTVAAHNEAACRRTAASKGKVYAKTVNRKNGTYDCRWCEPGHIFKKGRCWTPAAYNEKECRRTVAKKRKVYGRTVTHKNGTYNCYWCERGQYYAKGRCHSRQRAQPQPQPRPTPRVREPIPCLDGSLLGGGCGAKPSPKKTYPCAYRKGRGPYGC